MASGDYILAVLRAIIFVWDIITWPIYQIIYRPWEKRSAISRKRSKAIRTTKEEVVYETPEHQSDLFDDITRNKCDTMDKAWRWAVNRYGEKDLLGTRDLLAEEDEVQPNGKTFKKHQLGDYRFLSYNDVEESADYLGRGLRSLGLNSQDKLCIFADTRNEWFISSQACFKQGFPLVTLYTNLGEEAVVHGLNQTKATHIITTHDLLPKFRNILPHTPSVTTIVYMEDQIKTTDISKYPENIDILPFWDVITQGRRLSDSPKTAPVPPKPTDPAIIMYTSGSTGVPKGVILTHRNLFATLKSMMLSIDLPVRDDDAYIAFLPLAHVLELLCEIMLSMYGVKIGYSTPNTLLDKSSMIKRGSKGDATILRPTVMASVPLILDRVYKTIADALHKKGPRVEKVFNFCYEYRLNAVMNGEETPIMDFLLFSNLRALFGGRLRMMVSGGAPLSKETHNFIRTYMGCPVMQGYGLTETCACATMMDLDDLSTETVGPPNQGIQIKLINWEEGNYRVTDQPKPRGEIVIGGNSVAEGYYEMPEKTAEDFYTAHGKTWFRTGDIGQVEHDGTLKIIDRKKDLVKLQFGEYVSLGKVEASLKTCSVVENVCIYGDSKRSYTVALVCPVKNQLIEIAAKFGKEAMDFDALCLDPDLTGAVLRELINHGKKHKLEKFEIPAAATLCKEIWLPDSGLVTAAFKLKRKPIQQFYQRDLDRMYGVSSRSV